MPRKYKTRNSKKKIYGGSSNNGPPEHWEDQVEANQRGNSLDADHQRQVNLQSLPPAAKSIRKSPNRSEAIVSGSFTDVTPNSQSNNHSSIFELSPDSGNSNRPQISVGPAGVPSIPPSQMDAINQPYEGALLTPPPPNVKPHIGPIPPDQMGIGAGVTLPSTTSPQLPMPTTNQQPTSGVTPIGTLASNRPSINPTGINIGPASGPSGSLPTPTLDPNGDPKITQGFGKLQTYQGRCLELQDAYLYKHQEVLWYCRIINQLKDKIINIIQNHTHNNQRNIDYILNLIDTLEIDNDINMDNLIEKKEEQDTKIREVTNTLLRIRKEINKITSKEVPIVTQMVFPTREQFGEKFTTKAPTTFTSQQMPQMPHRSAPIVQSPVPVINIEPRVLGTTTTTETITQIGNKITNLQAFCQNLKLAYDDKHDNEIRPLYDMIIEIEGIITKLGQIIGEDTNFYQGNFNLLIEAINGLPDYTVEMEQLQELRRQQANLLGQAQYNMEQIITQKNDFITQLNNKRKEYERNNASVSVSGSNSFPSVPPGSLPMAAAPNSSSAPSGPSNSKKRTRTGTSPKRTALKRNRTIASVIKSKTNRLKRKKEEEKRRRKLIGLKKKKKNCRRKKKNNRRA
jgi:hypothetical protein